jgi:CxxC motif-containing protein (DUF1111 family)
MHLQAIFRSIVLGGLATTAMHTTSVGAAAQDPGVRSASGDKTTPAPLHGLGADELTFFADGLARFATVEVVTGATTTQGNGLGPLFNSNQCSSCHAQPNTGGSSPAANPLLSVAGADGATNTIPWFITAHGPIRVARFIKSNGAYDGGVHNLFSIAGRSDAGSCDAAQPTFTPAGNPLTGQGGNANIVFRIPTPLFGSGLIESIPDSAILANMHADAAQKARLGVQGRANSVQGGNVNLSANDGTITRFGWKAQVKSLLMFAGEAYNVEMGISNQLFPQERNEIASCQGGTAAPNDTNNFPLTASAYPATAVLSDIEAFANFMRMLAPPAAAPATVATNNGREQFIAVGCALCHTTSFKTGAAIASGSSRSPSPALSGKTVNLYSDLLVHHMGQGLADGLTQGLAGPDEFRTAPLWGIGQRVFFLHDGRTSDLSAAIQAHESRGSEASAVIEQFNGLNLAARQDVLDFLRSL